MNTSSIYIHHANTIGFTKWTVHQLFGVPLQAIASELKKRCDQGQAPHMSYVIFFFGPCDAMCIGNVK